MGTEKSRFMRAVADRQSWPRYARLASCAFLASMAVGGSPIAFADSAGAEPTVIRAAAHDTSPPLRDIKATATVHGGMAPINPPMPEARVQALQQSIAQHPSLKAKPSTNQVIHAALAATPMPALIQNFAGISNIGSGRGGRGYYPPDTNGDVGPNHYVQMVNVRFAVYSKTGTLLYGPVDNNTLWAGFGGPCETENSGDPIVQYDILADRWVISQFAVPAGDKFECVAVSKSGDPLGEYYRYAFPYGTDMPDYPKLGVWPDGYYVTYNMFDGTTDDFKGMKTCALERSKMLIGAQANQVCFDNPYPAVGQVKSEWSLLPADVDGHTPPPAGSPNYVLGEHWDDTSKLTMYRFSVDWTNPENSTFAGPIYLSVAPYTPACIDVFRNRCVPQPAKWHGYVALLESLGGRTMYRLAYRNFGSHESLVVNHSIALDDNPGLTKQIGLRWYEIRSPGTTPQVYQEGTSASETPGQFRWMGSIAMDHSGNIALGYSSSSTTLFPSINYIGRLATAPLGTMPFAEGLIKAGTGAQTGTGARWGDYTAMQVDPVDDCTFWYTNEYYETTSWKGWKTQIASFKFPECVP